jgi:hypothetical protein
MYLSASGLTQLLQQHVVELRFRRKHLKEGFNTQRRMLCTNDRNMLNSEAGKRILNYVPPTHSKKYNPLSKNLVVAYDIFMQQYRTINVGACDVIAVIATNPSDKWWDYFDKNVRQMNTAKKLVFMNN